MLGDRKMARRISIINFKGGVGKTTLAFQLAAGLSKQSRVLIVDVDHQSSLSLVCLKEKQWQSAIDQEKTVNSIFNHFITPGIPLPGKDIIFKHPIKDWRANYPKLDLLPAELQLDETELDLGSTGFGDPTLSQWSKRMLIARWMEQNGIDNDYDYIIFDCPPATKIVTQNAIAVSHGYIIPTIPDAVSTRGLPHLEKRMFTKIDEKMTGLAKYLRSKGRKLEKLYIKGTKLLGIVIFRIRTHGPAYSGYTTDHTTHLNYLLSKYSDMIIEPYIEDGVGVAESMRDGHPIYDCGYNSNVTNRGFIKVFEDITAECKKRIDRI